MDKNNILGTILSGVSTGTWLTSMFSEERIIGTISGITAIVSGLIAIGYTVWRWYKKATQTDSKGGSSITKEEAISGVKDVIKTIKDNKDDIKDGVDKITKGGKEDGNKD